MNCLHHTINDVQQNAWTHHIPRLMVVFKWANLAGVNPAALTRWFRSVYMDTYDWVMWPNVLGRGWRAEVHQALCIECAIYQENVARLLRPVRLQTQRSPTLRFTDCDLLLPNPIAFLLNERYWYTPDGKPILIDAPRSPVHGDLHSGNLICVAG